MSEIAVRPFVSAARVRDRYGISDMTLWRWLRDPVLNFPRPMTIHGRRYWREDCLSEWEGARSPKACASTEALQSRS